jgi:hypothetical protein
LPFPPALLELVEELLELVPVPVPVPVPDPEPVVAVLAVYETWKELSEIKVTSVKISLLVFSMSIIVAEETPSDDSLVEATHSVKVTLPKLAKATSASPSSKSSTIHSAFSPPRAEVEVSVLETDFPVVRFSIVAVPEVVVVALTYIAITFSQSVSMHVIRGTDNSHHLQRS